MHYLDSVLTAHILLLVAMIMSSGFPKLSAFMMLLAFLMAIKAVVSLMKDTWDERKGS